MAIMELPALHAGFMHILKIRVLGGIPDVWLQGGKICRVFQGLGSMDVCDANPRVNCIQRRNEIDIHDECGALVHLLLMKF